jgi:hypothetical protein
MIKCTCCGEEKDKTEFYSKGPKRTYKECKTCFKKRMVIRTREQAEFIYSIVGSCCSVCGYNKCDAALELHHLDPKLKEFQISKSRSYSKEKILSEIKKCVLLCSNCHREVHAGLLNLGQ